MSLRWYLAIAPAAAVYCRARDHAMRVYWGGYERSNQSSSTTNAEWQGCRIVGPEPVNAVTVLRMTLIHIHGTWICLGGVRSSNYFCTFRTRAGEETLAHWLLEPATPDEIRARQNAAQELKADVEFRERLFTAGDRVRLGLHPNLLTTWESRCLRSALDGCPCRRLRSQFLWVASLVYGFLRDFYAPVLLLSFVNLFVNSRISKRLEPSFEAVEASSSDLDLLVGILKILEREQFKSPRLVHLQSALEAGGITPSAAVRKLDRIVHYLEQRRNLLVRLLNGFVFYSVQLYLRAESWQREFGPAIRGGLPLLGKWRCSPRFLATRLNIPTTRGQNSTMSARLRCGIARASLAARKQGCPKRSETG